MERSGIVVGVAMRHDHTVDVAIRSGATPNQLRRFCPRVRNLHSIQAQNRAGVGRRVDHVAASIDPEDESRRGAVVVESV